MSNPKSFQTLTLALAIVASFPLAAQQPGPEPDQNPQQRNGFQRAGEPQALPQQASNAAPLVLPAGTWISIRVNQPLSSDRNLPGDSFTATLAQPIIADGIVVARRGQTLAGRVAEAVKGGRVKGTSRLGVEITELSLVDGQQVPVRAQLVQSSAGTSKGRDAGAIGTTTGVGAAIGAVAGGGFGAGMGAIAGAGAAAIGVLVTRGHATEIYPEEMITFRTLAPITISTARSEYAFQPIRQEDYPNSQVPQFVTRPVTNLAASPFFYGGGLGNGYGNGWGYGYGRGWGPGYGFYGGPRNIIGGGRGFRHHR